MSNSWWLRKDIPFEYFSPVFADIDHTADKNCYTGSYHSCLLHHIEAWVEDARPASVFLHPGTNLQWKLNERQIATARLLFFFCTRSSILILKFSSQKCFFFTMFENHFKKSLILQHCKVYFWRKIKSNKFVDKNSWKHNSFAVFGCWQLWFHVKNCGNYFVEKIREKTTVLHWF